MSGLQRELAAHAQARRGSVACAAARLTDRIGQLGLAPVFDLVDQVARDSSRWASGLRSVGCGDRRL